MAQKILQIPCGILKFDETTKKVTADKSKGELKLELTSDNELKLQWINLSKGQEVEIERFLFIQDASFEKVYNQNRVYILKFKTDSDLYFFWMQSSDLSTDDKYCLQFNQLVNSQYSEEEQQQQQPSNVINENAMQQLIQQLSQKPLQISLNDVLNQDFLKSISQDEDYLNEILLLLPEEQRDPDFVKENLLSPQFQQAVDSLESALRSQERGGVIQSLELDSSILQQEYDGVMAMLRAIQKKVQNQKN